MGGGKTRRRLCILGSLRSKFLVFIFVPSRQQQRLLYAAMARAFTKLRCEACFFAISILLRRDAVVIPDPSRRSPKPCGPRPEPDERQPLLLSERRLRLFEVEDVEEDLDVDARAPVIVFINLVVVVLVEAEEILIRLGFSNDDSASTQGNAVSDFSTAGVDGGATLSFTSLFRMEATYFSRSLDRSKTNKAMGF
jgi:hypothetical protein